jgi:hypothetical protein
VCEGEKTEPNYFRSFPVDPKVIKLEIKGEGKNTKSLVENAISLKNDSESDETDRFWCVFDRDKSPKNPNYSQNFNSAITLARNNGIDVAYSNDAFELWYLLHFHFYNPNPETDNPSTTVHLLVEELNSFIPD